MFFDVISNPPCEQVHRARKHFSQTIAKVVPWQEAGSVSWITTNSDLTPESTETKYYNTPVVVSKSLLKCLCISLDPVFVYENIMRSQFGLGEFGPDHSKKCFLCCLFGGFAVVVCIYHVCKRGVLYTYCKSEIAFHVWARVMPLCHRDKL